MLELMENAGILLQIAVAIPLLLLLLYWLFKRQTNDSGQLTENAMRYRLAMMIVVPGFIFVIVLGLVCLLLGGDCQAVFSSILPLIGTWVGAVIAFYFGNENLKTATESVKALLSSEERLAATKVVEPMMKLSDVDGLVEMSEADFLSSSIRKFVNQMARQRAPVLNIEKLAIAIVHKSTALEYLALHATDQEADTFAQMRDSQPVLWQKLKAMAFVDPTVTAADARRAMREQGPVCADVFVTSDGKPTGTVIGWITNVDLLKLEKGG